MKCCNSHTQFTFPMICQKAMRNLCFQLISVLLFVYFIKECIKEHTSMTNTMSPQYTWVDIKKHIKWLLVALFESSMGFWTPVAKC